MSAISSVSSNTDNQWQLLQQLRASRAAETLAATGATGTGATGTGAAATGAATAASSTALLPTGSSQSGSNTSTGTASGSSGIFDTVAAKLMSGMQSFLVNMQSDTSTGANATGSRQGYGMSSANNAASSATSVLSV